jgi:RecB family exonuclease
MTNPARLAVVPDRETREKAGRFLDRIEQARALRAGAPATVDAPPASRFSEPKPLDPTAILSPSSVNQFNDCEARWFYRKVLELPETRGAALGLGAAIHQAITENFRQKLETKRDLPTEGVSALFLDAMNRQLDEITLAKDESADELKQCGEVMTRVYMDQIAPRIQPAAVEKHVSGLIGNVPVQGYIDLLDVNGDVIDLKTASKKPSGINAGYRVQVATYAMLEPTASGRARLDTLTKTRTIQTHEQSLQVGEADRKYTERLYSITQEKMRSGLFSPNRSSHLCSRKYCSYADRCIADYGGYVG